MNFGKTANGIVELDDYKLRIGPAASRFFRTTTDNFRLDTKQTLTFPYSGFNYTASLDELRNLANSSQLYGGKLITKAPTRTNEPQYVFANHGIMVARPGEPTLKRLVESLLKDVPDNREARIQRLVDFVSTEIEYSYTEAVASGEKLKRASETLMTRNGDCSNKTILLASLLEEMAAMVRPQKFPSTKTTFAWFSEMPFTAYPQRLASFTAVSPPSTPVFIGNTLSYPK